MIFIQNKLNLCLRNKVVKYKKKKKKTKTKREIINKNKCNKNKLLEKKIQYLKYNN